MNLTQTKSIAGSLGKPSKLPGLVTPWDLVENHPCRDLCELIEDTCISAERTFPGDAINA